MGDMEKAVCMTDHFDKIQKLPDPIQVFQTSAEFRASRSTAVVNQLLRDSRRFWRK